MPDLRVLLIDDEPAQAFLVREYLRPFSKIAVEHAETLSAGFECLSRGDTDVLILDLSLPDSYADSTFERVHDRFPSVPVVVLTSMEDEEYGLQLVQAGAQDYLVKGRIDGLLLYRTLRYAIERKSAQLERDRLIEQLQQALDEVKKLSGLLPICAHCKKIRDDDGEWTQIEQYIHERSEADFTHGICPDCVKIHYPQVYGKI